MCDVLGFVVVIKFFINCSDKRNYSFVRFHLCFISSFIEMKQSGNLHKVPPHSVVTVSKPIMSSRSVAAWASVGKRRTDGEEKGKEVGPVCVSGSLKSSSIRLNGVDMKVGWDHAPVSSPILSRSPLGSNGWSSVSISKPVLSGSSSTYIMSPSSAVAWASVEKKSESEYGSGSLSSNCSGGGWKKTDSKKTPPSRCYGYIIPSSDLKKKGEFYCPGVMIYSKDRLYQWKSCTSPKYLNFCGVFALPYCIDRDGSLVIHSAYGPVGSRAHVRSY